VAAGVGLNALPAQAERILYVDAAAPGSLPDFFWTDLTTNEYDFISTGSPPPVHVDNAGSS